MFPRFLSPMKKVILILALLLLLAGSFFAGRWTKHPKEIEVEIVRTDTLTVWDTVHVERPVYLTERIVDSIYVPISDTLRLRDTTYIVLPRTQKEYSDSLYRAWVSGYQPQLDSIKLFTPIKYITTTVREPARKWHIGITAGYGVGKNGLSPYLGVGVSYSVFSF